MTIRRMSLSSALLALVAACDAGTGRGAVVVAKPVIAFAPKCKGAGCGDNGILLNGVWFHELNAGGAQNAEGMSLRALRSPPGADGKRVLLSLRVQGDVL